MTADLQIGEREQKLGLGTAIDKSIAGLGPDVVARRSARAASETARLAIRTAGGAAEAIETDAPGSTTCPDVELAQTAAAAIRRTTVPAGKARVIVRNGWLILEGEVEGPAQKRAAEEAVRGLAGIRGISNNILIESEVMAQRVSQKIDETFVRSARISANRISVTARDHRIILSGSVRSAEERAEAETAAWGVPGVAQVVNRIRANV